jgi:hypothetical protein
LHSGDPVLIKEKIMENLTPAEQYLAEKEKRIELYTRRWELAKDPLTGRDLSGSDYDCWLYHMNYNKTTKEYSEQKLTEKEKVAQTFIKNGRKPANYFE